MGSKWNYSRFEELVEKESSIWNEKIQKRNKEKNSIRKEEKIFRKQNYKK